MFLPLMGRLGEELKEKTTHPPFVPPIKGGIILIHVVAEGDLIKCLVRTLISADKCKGAKR